MLRLHGKAILPLEKSCLHCPRIPIYQEDCEIFDEGFRKCCDIVDAHDPSIGRNAVPPAPDEIAKDIAKLKAWIISLRQRQKSLLRSESAGR